MADGKKKKQPNSDANTGPAPRSRKRSTAPADNIDEDAVPTTPRPTRRQIGGEARTASSAPGAEPSRPVTTRQRARAARAEEVAARRAAADPGGVIAERYVEQEILNARDNFRNTVIAAVIILIIIIGSLSYSTIGFANAMQPQEAANITEGVIASHLDDYIPQAKSQLKEQVPTLIAKVPDYAKEQLPKFRQRLEDELDKSVQDFANQSKPELQQMVNSFLTANKEDVRALVENTRDPQSTAALEANLREMFTEYLDTSKVGGETLKEKLDSALLEIAAIDQGVKKLAANKGLSTNEQRARRAIAILMRSVDADPDLRSVADVIQSYKTTAVNGVLQWQSQDEAVFQQPGKPPVVLIRKPGAPAPPPK